MSVLLVIAAVVQAAEASFEFAGLSLMAEPWQKDRNFALLERYARQAAAKGAKVIATPEGFLEGYVANINRSPGLDREKYFSVGEAIDGPLLSRVAGLARELKVHLLIGFAERRAGKMYNTAAIFGPDGALVSRYAKSHTAADEPFNAQGTEFPVAQTALGRWGTLICFDRQLPETARVLTLRGAQFILVPAWGSSGEMNDQMMRVRAYENGVWLAFVHPRRCLIINPRGTIVAQNQGEGDQIVTATITLRDGKPVQLLRERRPELYGDIVKQK